MNDEEISRQLNSFSISSEEEQLTTKFGQARIANTSTPSIFSVPTRQSHDPFLLPPPPPPPPPSTTVPDWTSSHNTAISTGFDSSAPWDQADKKQEQGEGWGESLPSYTSIQQGTYFGFNSIMTPSTLPSTTNIEEGSISLSSNSKGFNQFKNQPVTFYSAAATAQYDENTRKE